PELTWVFGQACRHPGQVLLDRGGLLRENGEVQAAHEGRRSRRARYPASRIGWASHQKETASNQKRSKRSGADWKSTRPSPAARKRSSPEAWARSPRSTRSLPKRSTALARNPSPSKPGPARNPRSQSEPRWESPLALEP